jgi:diguanylate cyclase (GGDEF)-like protein
MPWQFDIRTAILIGALLTFLIGTMMYAVSSTQPDAYRGTMRWWVVGALSYALGFVLTGMRDWIWIGWSAVLGNGLIAVGMACFAIALRRFFGLPEWRKRLLLIVPPLAMVVSTVLVFVVPADDIRLGLISMLLASLAGVCVQSIYGHALPRTLSQHIIGFYFLLGLATLMARSVATLLLRLPQHGIFEVTPLTLSVYVVGGLMPVVGTIAFLLMCTERSQREIERTARIDHLTGIYNRGAIEGLAGRMIASSLRHGTPMSLMVVDIDHFKRINDELGHAAGDKALLATVQMMQALVRACDLLGRLGGEEFVVLMPDTDAVQARRAAERMRTEVEQTPVTFFGTFRSLTVSIGVSEYRVEDGGFDRLLQRADRALYEAKHSGRNRVLVDLMAPDTLVAV